MYTTNRPRPHSQTHSQAFPPTISYQGEEYYMPPPGPSHMPPDVAPSSISRQFNGDHARGDMYHESSFYEGPRKTYDDGEHTQTSNMMYSQSYDRSHPSPPHLHISSSSYRNQYPDRLQQHVATTPLHHMKRPELPPMLDDFAMSQPHAGFAPEPPILTSHSERSIDSNLWATDHIAHTQSPMTPSPEILAPAPAEPAKPKKPRREKPKIELDKNQPPTTQGKKRARVFVACIQCRTRKIRCDGARPACHNCGRRSTGSNECTYDENPKRRGPDKCPGARQRMACVGNKMDAPRRRRRGTAQSARGDTASTSDGYVNPQAQQEQACQPLSLVPPATTVPDHSQSHHQTICSPTPDFPPVSNYVRQYSPNCGCHGLVHCPDMLKLTNHGRKASASQISPTTYNHSVNQFHLTIHSNNVDGIRGAYVTDFDTSEITGQPSLNSKVSLLPCDSSTNSFPISQLTTA